MTEEEREELQELIKLLYNNHLSQYGKRKLESYIKQLQKEVDKKDICLKACEDNLIKERQLRIKQDKVINLIAESWKQDDVRSVEEIKEYFINKWRNKMNLDITYCSNMNCKNKECTRNLKNYKKTNLYKKDIIKYISVSTFEECEFWEVENER